MTTRETSTSKICVCHDENKQFCTLCTCTFFATVFFQSTIWNDLFWNCIADVTKRHNCCLFFLLFPNRWYQFHSNLIRTHFWLKSMFPLPSSFSFFRSYFHDQCALRAVPVHSPQSLSTINISYWMALRREITQTMNFQFPYAGQFVERFDN